MDTTPATRRRMSGPAWLILGVILAAILVPASTVAAVSMFRLQGGNNNVANVTKANQLLTVDSAPSVYFMSGYLDVGGTCSVIAHAPATKGLVIDQMRFNVKTSGGFDASHVVVVTVSSDCSGGYVLILQPDHLGSYTIPMSPGLPVPAGGHLSAETISGVTGEMDVTGYTVPAADVP